MMFNLLRKLDRYGMYQGGICRVFEGEDGEGGGGGESTSPVNADGTFVENWHSKYGEENTAHLSRYKDFPSFVESHISQRKKFSKDPTTLVEIPNEHSSDEVKVAFRKASGVGDSADDYVYTLPDELSTKLEAIDDVKMAAIKKFAYEELELSPSKFKKLLDFHHHDIASSIDKYDILFTEQNATAAATAKTELRKQDGWRSEDEYNNKVLLANSVMRKYGGENAVAEFNAENSPAMTKFLNNIAGAMSESTLKGLVPATGTTTDSLKAQITTIRTRMDAIQKENPSNFRGNIEYKELIVRKKELYKQFPAK